MLDYGAGQATNLLELMLTVLGGGLLAGRLARFLRLPDVVLYLLLGLRIGPFGFGLVRIPGPRWSASWSSCSGPPISCSTAAGLST